MAGSNQRRIEQDRKLLFTWPWLWCHLKGLFRKSNQPKLFRMGSWEHFRLYWRRTFKIFKNYLNYKFITRHPFIKCRTYLYTKICVCLNKVFIAKNIIWSVWNQSFLNSKKNSRRNFVTDFNFNFVEVWAFILKVYDWVILQIRLML